MIEPSLSPEEWGPAIRVGVWAVILAFLAFAMLRHAKGAWVAALALAGLGLLGGFRFVTLFHEARDKIFWFYLSGFVISALDVAVLVSRSARNWVNQPVTRKTDLGSIGR